VFTRVATFLAFERSFTGGVRLAAAPASLGASAGVDFHFLAAPGPGRLFEVSAWRIGADAATLVRTLVPAPGYSAGGFAIVADLDVDGTAELVLSTGAPAEPIVGVMSYPTGQVLGLLRPFPGGHALGAHIAVGRIAGGAQPYVFVTPAEGVGGTIDVYRVEGGTFSLVVRVPIVEVP
jgi:hypothetical protein